jgi:nitrogen regulatory protein P-II 1
MFKKIEAIIREDKVNDVKDALSEIVIVGLNIFEIRGHGRQGGIKLAGVPERTWWTCSPRSRSISC